VVQHARLFLRQNHNPPRPVGEPLEHMSTLCRRGCGRLPVACAESEPDLGFPIFYSNVSPLCHVFAVSVRVSL
jgi:hypothetical protein